jgi:outer membrane protein TolC
LALYFDLIYSSENLRVRQGAVHTARLLERQNIQRVQVGKMRPSDVWEAQTSVANNADLALRAVNAYVETQNQLKGQILSSESIAAGPTGRLEPSSSLEIPPVTVDRDQFLREAFTKRPEYLKVQSAVEQEGLKVRFARNQVYPQVDLQASYGLTGLEGNFGSSFNNTLNSGGPALTVGVVVSIPLGSVKERSSLQAAKYRQQQTSLTLQKVANQVVLEIDTAISLFQTTGSQVEAAQETTRTARLTAETQEKLLEEGKTTTFDVVRLQNDYADARSRELAALANHRKAALRLAVARGALLEELGVDIQKESEKTQPFGVRRKVDLPPTNLP